MLDEFQSLKDRKKELFDLETQIHDLNVKHSDLRREIIDQSHKVGHVYGKCKKELICRHWSYEHKADDTTTIKVGQIIHFDTFPLENYIELRRSWQEYITVEMNEEYFDIFVSKELLPSDNNYLLTDE